MLKKAKSIIFALNEYGLRICFFNYFSMLISNICVISFERSGRTWLRVMLAKVFSVKYGIKKMRLDTQLMTLFKPAPNVIFSHAGCTRKGGTKLNFRNMFKRKKIILLARDPKDQIVSFFHNQTKRNFRYKGGDISDFIRTPDWGIKNVIKFMNYWAEEMGKRKDDFLLVRYEDMQKDTHKELKRILDFIKIKVDNNIIDEAVKYGSFENMRKMELSATIKDWRILPVNKKDRNSFKTRKGKVGTYQEELNKEDIEHINKEIKEKLNPVFGY